MYDEMKIDEPVYSFRMFDEKYGIPLNDERYTVILNASCSTGKVPERFRALFEYLKTGEVAGEDDFIEKIDARVREFQDDEEIKRMMSVEDEMRLFYGKKYEEKMERELNERLEQEIKQRLELKAQETARAMKVGNEPVEKIVKYTGLSREEIDKL